MTASGDPGALVIPVNVWTVPVNGYISPVLVLFTLCVNTVVCAVLLRPGKTVYTLMLSHSAGTLRSDCTKNS